MFFMISIISIIRIANLVRPIPAVVVVVALVGPWEAHAVWARELASLTTCNYPDRQTLGWGELV